MRLKIVHASDLHLGSKVRLPAACARVWESFVAPPRTSPVLWALHRLVDLCIDEGASLLVVAGDLFDGHHRLYETGLVFVEELLRLERAKIRTVWVRGNHDAASRVLKNLLLPPLAKELGLGGPETLVLEDLGLALHGFSYPERNVTEDLSARYPAQISGLLNLGLLHTSAEGRVGHDPYAPCTVRRLVEHGYDYWALGHVHRREIAHREPWVVYPGNLQGRSSREPGPKGAVVLTVENGVLSSVEGRALDVVRFEECRVDVRGARSCDDVAERVLEALRSEAQRAGWRPLVACLVLQGGAELGLIFCLDAERRMGLLRQAAVEAGRLAAGVWLEEVWAELIEPPYGWWELSSGLAHDIGGGRGLPPLGKLRVHDEADGSLGSPNPVTPPHLKGFPQAPRIERAT